MSRSSSISVAPNLSGTGHHTRPRSSAYSQSSVTTLSAGPSASTSETYYSPTSYISSALSPDSITEFTKMPITKALLQAVADNPNLNSKACVIFWSILHFMGEIHSTQRFTYIELTDEIFGPPLVLKLYLLKDEIYLQLMKQLTRNPDVRSKERAWQLMWLATGLFVPTMDIMRSQLLHFLEHHRHPYSLESMRRYRKTLQVGERKLPAHLIEVEAILNRTSMIFHKFYFPDSSDILIEVDSTTTVADIISAIVSRLQIKDDFGFALFIEYENRATSMPENEFFFDVLRQQQAIWVQNFLQDHKNVEYGPPYFQYAVYFLKKIWLKTVPGDDPAADQICHYNQESSKYLDGYHKCTVDEAAWLGALIFAAENNDESKLSLISQMLKSLIPQHMISLESEGSWAKRIAEYYRWHGRMTPEAAKTKFLLYVYKWPTFGSAFFNVWQTGESILPSELIIGINKNGVMLINAETKDLIALQPFSKITSWNYSSTEFEILMTDGRQNVEKKFTCLTKMGYKMDDLLRVYMELQSQNMLPNPPQTMSSAGSHASENANNIEEPYGSSEDLSGDGNNWHQRNGNGSGNSGGNRRRRRIHNTYRAAGGTNSMRPSLDMNNNNNNNGESNNRGHRGRLLIERPTEDTNGRGNAGSATNDSDWEERIYDYDGVARIRPYNGSANGGGGSRSNRPNSVHHNHHHHGGTGHRSHRHGSHRDSPHSRGENGEALVTVHQSAPSYDNNGPNNQSQRFIHHFDTVRPLADNGDRDSVSGSSVSTISTLNTANVGADRGGDRQITPPEIPPRPRSLRSDQYARSSHHRHNHSGHRHQHNATAPSGGGGGGNWVENNAVIDHRHRSYHEGGALD